MTQFYVVYVRQRKSGNETNIYVTGREHDSEDRNDALQMDKVSAEKLCTRMRNKKHLDACIAIVTKHYTKAASDDLPRFVDS